MSVGVNNKENDYRGRRSIRLQGYDYSQQGSYFITICIHDYNTLFFGDVVNGKMIKNDAGKFAHKCWMDIPKHYPGGDNAGGGNDT